MRQSQVASVVGASGIATKNAFWAGFTPIATGQNDCTGREVDTGDLTPRDREKFHDV
ncbi:hypothetical protein RSSM_05839 [Rhodopirellula sallentina SM41]|uniref:Uncharacterized protein n=1 Tax=Rhodopirellula sallentina SM41 TaxID=1263870 RepID=M5U9T0_9BACT|nr:hypothetical protein RSSM_05839 [Rhodopirellula sallentina SM41]